jgi:predicted metal-dependent phosphoesterase TrpH
MKIDLHIHSRCSDGRLTLNAIFKEAVKKGLSLISITDHDSIDCQVDASIMAKRYGINYLYGLELNVTFSPQGYKDLKPISLDFLAYQYDIHSKPLVIKLNEMRKYREKRAEKILDNINRELVNQRLKEFTRKDLEKIEKSVHGAFGRPHIADYMVHKGIVSSRKEAFGRYLVKCNVPKMPLTFAEASRLVRGAGGKLFLAHPNHPRGTSLIKISTDLREQQKIIKQIMIPYIDGVECWHSAHDKKSTASYIKFAQATGLMVTGGSDCHQRPVLIGTVDVPDYVAEQFNIKL